MSRVLLMGASGMVGHYVIPRLLAAGLEVHGLSRSDRSGRGVHWHVADLQGRDWYADLPSMGIALHVAPLWLLPAALPGLRNLGVERLIAFGSTSCITKADSSSAAERALASRLADAESALARDAGDIQWTVFRPTLIWGGGRDRNVTVIARFIRRFGFFPLAGRAPGLRQPVHADDLAQACIAALHNDGCHGRCLNLGGGEVLSYRAMVLRIFAALDRPPRVMSFPPRLLRTAAFLVHRLGGQADPAVIDRMATDMVFDLDPVRRLIGYDPRPFHPGRADLGEVP